MAILPRTIFFTAQPNDEIVNLVCYCVDCKFNLMNAVNSVDKQSLGCGLKYIIIDEDGTCKSKDIEDIMKRDTSIYTCDICNEKSTEHPDIMRWFALKYNQFACPACGHKIKDILEKLDIPFKMECTQYSDKPKMRYIFVDYEILRSDLKKC